jgi:acyl dehydratase
MLCFEDFKIGDVYELGNYKVTEEEIISFAKQYDPQVYHINSVKALETSFNGLVASGWLTAAICMRLICESFVMKSNCRGSPGVDKLSWKLPVRPGDEITGTNEIIETRLSSKGKPQGTVTSRVIMSNQNKEIVMTMISHGIFFTRDEPS